ncbi:MAG TPA: serine/threonine-protein kinase [Trebonia sp.]
MRALRPGDPTEIGGYQLRGFLGAGGMGTVYLASTPGGRLVAVKSIRSELVEDDEFLERFQLEVRAARQVRGLYTAELLDADPDGSPPWLVTAYVRGPSLAHAVKAEGPVPPELVPLLMAGVAEALLDIHSAGIVHRDLKASNVLLSSDGPRVIDFGIAKALDASRVTLTGAVMGSPECMSPEQVRGLPVTQAADVFALGSLCVFAATGRSPFAAPNSAAMMYRVLNEAPVLDGIPAPLHQLLEPCFAKEPGERPTPAEILKMCRDLMPERPAVFPQSWRPDADGGETGLPRAEELVPGGGPRPASGRMPLGLDSFDAAPPQPANVWDSPARGWGTGAVKSAPGHAMSGPAEAVLTGPVLTEAAETTPTGSAETRLTGPALTMLPTRTEAALPGPEAEPLPPLGPGSPLVSRAPLASRAQVTAWLMGGAAGLATAALAVGLVTVPGLRTTLGQQHPGSGAVASAVDLAVVVLVIRTLTGAGTWLWAALDTLHGHRRARTIAAVAVAVSTLGLASSLLGPSTTVVQGLTLAGWLVGLAAVAVGRPRGNRR